MTKTYKCRKCKIIVELNNWNPHKYMCKQPCAHLDMKKYRGAHKDELKAKRIQYRIDKPDVWRNRNLVKNYGITLEQYNTMLAVQNGVCKGCKKSEVARGKRYRHLSVDHDHKTGKIRGLLCNKCNRSLGLLEDNFDCLVNLARYVQEHSNTI